MQKIYKGIQRVHEIVYKKYPMGMQRVFKVVYREYVPVDHGWEGVFTGKKVKTRRFACHQLYDLIFI